MLHAISWSVFLISLICVCLAYWLFIGLFYYSRELKSLLAGKSNGKPGSMNNSGSSMFLGTEDHPQEDRNHAKVAEDIRNTALFPVAYRLVDELKEAIKESAVKKAAKEELFFAIQIILGQDTYSKLKDTPFKIAINNLIETECLAKAGIGLKTEELNILWKR